VISTGNTDETPVSLDLPRISHEVRRVLNRESVVSILSNTTVRGGTNGNRNTDNYITPMSIPSTLRD
jgi:hypothetical protein